MAEVFYLTLPKGREDKRPTPVIIKKKFTNFFKRSKTFDNYDTWVRPGLFRRRDPHPEPVCINRFR